MYHFDDTPYIPESSILSNSIAHKRGPCTLLLCKSYKSEPGRRIVVKQRHCEKGLLFFTIVESGLGHFHDEKGHFAAEMGYFQDKKRTLKKQRVLL